MGPEGQVTGRLWSEPIPRVEPLAKNVPSFRLQVGRPAPGLGRSEEKRTAC